MRPLSTIENLSTDECLGLLAGQQLGHLSVAADDGVHVFPVNYVVDGDAIVIRSGASALVRLAPLRRVEVEVDHIDAENGTFWTVVTAGTTQLVTDALDTISERTRTLTLPDWSHSPRPEWLRIPITRIVGVRLVSDLATDRSPDGPGTGNPAGSDLIGRRLLNEVRMRLLALTQTDSTGQADAETLRHGADELETIVRRLHFLADMTGQLPASSPPPAA